MHAIQQHCYAVMRPRASELSMRLAKIAPRIRTRSRYKKALLACINSWLKFWGASRNLYNLPCEEMWDVYETLIRQGHLNFLYGKLPHDNDNEFD